MVRAVCIVLMPRNAQCLRDDIILEGDVHSPTSAYRLICPPGCGTMVHDGVVGTTHPHRITRILAIDTQATLEPDMAANDV